MKYIFVDFFHPYFMEYYQYAFNYIENSDQKVIPIVVSSYGGYVDCLTQLMDMIEGSKKPVMTITEGMCMSCGAMLAASGTKGMRYIGPNSRMMIHSVSGMSWGKSAEMVSDAKEAERLTQWSYKKLDESAGKEEGYTLSLIKENMNADLYLSAEEAVRHGYCDKVMAQNQAWSQMEDIFTEWKKAQEEQEEE